MNHSNVVLKCWKRSFATQTQTERGLTMKQSAFLIALLLFAFIGSIQQATAQGSSFAYQGRLTDQNVPANGNYDLRFLIFDVPTGGVAIAPPITNANVAVSGGLFTVVVMTRASARWNSMV